MARMSKKDREIAHRIALNAINAAKGRRLDDYQTLDECETELNKTLFELEFPLYDDPIELEADRLWCDQLSAKAEQLWQMELATR